MEDRLGEKDLHNTKLHSTHVLYMYMAYVYKPIAVLHTVNII